MQFTYEFLDNNYNFARLKFELMKLGGTPGTKNRQQIIDDILKIQSGEITPQKSRRGRPRNGAKLIDNESVFDCDGETLDNVSVHDHEIEFNYTEKVSGVFDVTSDGYGYLRVKNFSPSKDDFAVPRSIISSFSLMRGDFVEAVGTKKSKLELGVVTDITSINGKNPQSIERISDEDAIYPNEQIVLAKGEPLLRAIDLFTPIAKGQRGIIISPSGAGKTSLVKLIAKQISNNYPSTRLFVLLVDERPEVVTDFKKSLDCELVYSTFDMSSEHHVKTSELLLNHAKRLMEMGEDVMILVDSLSALVRASISTYEMNVKLDAKEINPNSLIIPKKFMASARNTERGSLTILATLETETGNSVDDLIFDEFTGVNNIVISLTNKGAIGVYPKLDLNNCSVKNPECIVDRKTVNGVRLLKKLLTDGTINVDDFLEMLESAESDEELFAYAESLLK